MMTTELGTKIEDILRQTSSITSLVEFLRDNELFTRCEPIDEYKYGYLYRIGFEEWTKATGIDPESLLTRYTYNFCLGFIYFLRRRVVPPLDKVFPFINLFINFFEADKFVFCSYSYSGSSSSSSSSSSPILFLS